MSDGDCGDAGGDGLDDGCGGDHHHDDHCQGWHMDGLDWDDVGGGEGGTVANPLHKSASQKELLERLGHRQKLIAYVNQHPEFKRILKTVVDQNFENPHEFQDALKKALMDNGAKEDVAQLLSKIGAGHHLSNKHLWAEAGEYFERNNVAEKAAALTRRAAEGHGQGGKTAIIAGATALVGLVAGWVARARMDEKASRQTEAQR